MNDSRGARKRAQKPKKQQPGRQDVSGEAAAFEWNREREARGGIVEAFGRLGISYDKWPAFVREYHTDLYQQTEFHQYMKPLPFQPPEFDRLNQTPEEWIKASNTAWELHQQKFLKQNQDWASAGVDEEVVKVKRARGPGKRTRGHLGGRRREENTPLNLRFEWAAKYLLHIPLKEIAGEAAEVSRVGKLAREIVRSAAWPTE